MNQNQPPKTVSEMYPSKWLKADDIVKPVVAAIVKAEPELVFNRQSNEQEWKVVLTLYQVDKKFILNKTQCAALETITGTEHFSDWKGHQVLLKRGFTRSKQPTIVIEKIEGKAATPPPPPPQGNGEPEIFRDVSHALHWAVGQGAFATPEDASTIYSNLKVELKPKTAREMADIWKKEIARRLEEAQPEPQPEEPPLEEMENPF